MHTSHTYIACMHACIITLCHTFIHAYIACILTCMCKLAAGYTLPEIPKLAKLWVLTAKNIVRAQFLRAIEDKTDTVYADGDVYNVRSKTPKKGVVVSAILGKYNTNTAIALIDSTDTEDAEAADTNEAKRFVYLDKVVDDLIEQLYATDSKISTGKELPDVDSKMIQYCSRDHLNTFPFDEHDLGLNTKICKSIFNQI